MATIPVTNTSYDDRSLPTPETQPVFTESAVENAQPVIPLGPQAWLARVRVEWNAVINDRTQRRLLAAVVAFGLIGGMVGGVTATRSSDSQQHEQVVAAADVAAVNQTTPEQANDLNAASIAVEDDPSIVIPETSRKAKKNSARSYVRPAPGERKAYRFAVIYGDSDFNYRGKRGRKHHD